MPTYALVSVWVRIHGQNDSYQQRDREKKDKQTNKIKIKTTHNHIQRVLSNY